MNSIWDTPFIVVDVETTGADSVKNRLTDIACVTVLGGEIISEYSSLINPRQHIPSFISKMTGITNEMAFNAPEPDEILPVVANFFSMPGAIFVGHNSNFDYGFVSRSFERELMPLPKLPQLCTLKLARRLLAGSQKKNVGSLAAYFGIRIRDRHRALGDARATALVLLELIELAEREHNIESLEQLIAFQNQPISKFKPKKVVPEKVEEQLKKLPDEPGVYYFLGKSGKVLYVGKAKSLRDRVKSYFRDDSLHSRKIYELIKRVNSFRFSMTGTELSALLLESKEIKRRQPSYNTADKQIRHYPFIKLTTNENFPRLEICFSIDNDSAEYFGPFRSPYLADVIVKAIDRRFKLRKCDKIIKPSPENKFCFDFHIHRCDSPCSAGISIEDYALEVDKVRKFLTDYSESIVAFLEAKMLEHSEKLEFENAAEIKDLITQLKKLFARKSQVPTSVNKNNVILVLPASGREKTVEVFFIRSGKLLLQQILGRRSNLNDLYNNIHNLYFNGTLASFPYTIEDVDELRIISGWLYKQFERGSFLYLDGKSELEIRGEFESAVRNVQFDIIEEEEEKRKE
ncbi:MAG: hypothetical protein HW421_2045 [Ignavibacteria bacterium]|nr:hypothetical protein [Ignavibacteria bacterium]